MIDERCADQLMHSPNKHAKKSKPEPPTSTSIDWYAEGETRIVEVDGMRVIIRFVGRKGRRARIAIIAPAGAIFRSEEG